MWKFETINPLPHGQPQGNPALRDMQRDFREPQRSLKTPSRSFHGSGSTAIAPHTNYSKAMIIN
jgi:hypothetical protein